MITNLIINTAVYDPYVTLNKDNVVDQNKMTNFIILVICLNVRKDNVHGAICNLIIYSFYFVVDHFVVLSTVVGNFFLVHFVITMGSKVYVRVDFIYTNYVLNF